MNDVYFGCVFCLCVDSDNPDAPKIYFILCVLDTVKDESVMVFEASVEITVSDDSDLILNEIKNHPTYMHCLPSCPQIKSHIQA